MSTAAEPIKDPQTVTAAGEPVERLIEGVVVRPARPHVDKLGEVVEVFDPAWGVHPDPLVYVYQIALRPGAIKEWVLHRLQDDRIFLSRGTVRWALFDDRSGSPTHGRLNLLTFSERYRVLLIIPRGVYHAVENVGTDEAVF